MHSTLQQLHPASNVLDSYSLFTPCALQLRATCLCTRQQVIEASVAVQVCAPRHREAVRANA